MLYFGVSITREINEVYNLGELKHLKRVKNYGKAFDGTIRPDSHIYRIFSCHKCEIPYGLVVRIRGFHPRGPGSIPGMGKHFLLFVFRSHFSFSFFFLSVLSRFLNKETFKSWEKFKIILFNFTATAVTLGAFSFPELSLCFAFPLFGQSRSQ